MTLTACAGASVTRLDATDVKDVSGRWNDTDSRLVAEEMISDCLARPWYPKAQSDLKKNPTVIVGAVRNESSEHIAVATFVEDLQRALINSGKVQFVASSRERVDVRTERRDQNLDTSASMATRKPFGEETGADFMLSGTITSIVDQEGGKAVLFYQTNLKLLDVKTNEIVWNGQKKIKKLVTRSRVTF
jgi:hypothetical protein